MVSTAAAIAAQASSIQRDARAPAGASSASATAQATIVSQSVSAMSSVITMPKITYRRLEPSTAVIASSRTRHHRRSAIASRRSPCSESDEWHRNASHNAP